MNELTTKDMTEYLKNAMELEASIYRQKEAIWKGNSELERTIPKKRTAVKPYMKKAVEPKKIEKVGMALVVKRFIWFSIPGFFIMLCGALPESEYLIGLGIVFEIFMICFLFSILTKEKSAYEEYKRQYHTYELEMQDNEKVYKEKLEKYEIECASADKKYVEQMTAHDIAENALNQLKEPLEETQQLLARLYSADIIFPKYRNMIAMCTIYEYFASGRCTELNGADGAYNLYESELRQNLIINRLDTIIEQLDAIKANQYTLYTELKKTNEILTGISNDMKELTSTVHRIEDAAHIAAYCAQVTAQNTEALING